MKPVAAQRHMTRIRSRRPDVLGELRAPIVALAILALAFQAMLPVVAAKADPRMLSALSICLGNGDDPQDGDFGHSGACVCGSACYNGGCGGCAKADAASAAFDNPPEISGFARWSGSPAVIDRPGDRLARSRAPPLQS